MKVGDKVYFGRSHGEQTLGEIVKINPKKFKVKQLEQRGTLKSYPIGTIWTVPPSLCTPAPSDAKPGQEPAAEPPKAKRPDAEIMREIRGLYSALSPENLHMDGEISRSAAAARERQFNAKLKLCFTELGRTVTESEAYAGL